MFTEKKTPKKLRPMLVHSNSTPNRARTTWSTRRIFNDLCAKLEELEEAGWQVHTVDPRSSPQVGDYYWVLLRKPGVQSQPRTFA